MYEFTLKIKVPDANVEPYEMVKDGVADNADIALTIMHEGGAVIVGGALVSIKHSKI